MTDHTDLIRRLEAATGPDRGLDIEIANACFPEWRVSRDSWWNWHEGPFFAPEGDENCIRRDGRKDVPCNEVLPYFTRSLDAALTLVPGYHKWFAGRDWSNVWQEDVQFEFRQLDIHAASPAIALCIAALKARMED